MIIIANGSGVGALQRFLLDRKPFGRGSLNAFQPNSRYHKVLGKLREKEPDLAPMIAQILAAPSEGGMAGFRDGGATRVAALLAADGEDIGRADAIRMLVFADHPERGRGRGKDMDPVEQAKDIMAYVERWLNYENIRPTDLRDVGLSLIRIDRSTDPPRLMLWVLSGDTAKLARLLPRKMWGMPVVIHKDMPRMTYELPVVEEFGEGETTPVSPEARMPVNLFSEYVHLLKKVRGELKRMHKHVPEDDLRRTVFLHVAEQLGYTKEQLEQMIGERAWLRFSRAEPRISKRAGMGSGVLAFPGQYAEDIKSGKLERTIRPADMPVEPEEVVRAITYSGGDICRIKILSKETMSLPRLEKAFGKHVARSLEHSFGPDRRFVVIRFTRFNANEADDGALDEKKRGEVSEVSRF